MPRACELARTRYNKATMIASSLCPRRAILAPVPLAVLALLLAGCAVPWSAPPVHGNLVLRSPECHCRFTYPASWRFAAANGDPSTPTLSLASYDTSSADHVPVPRTFAIIGIDWRDDPLGQLYLATTTRHLSGGKGRSVVVSGRSATLYSSWTAPPAQGGVYVEHIYLFVPWYQRDYDLSFQAANPPSNDVRALHSVFASVVHSLTIVPPNALP